MIEQCSVCGQDCQAWTPGGVLPALARNAAGAVFCQVCAADLDRASIEAREPMGAYLSSDGKAITTWAGEPLARVTQTGVSHGGWHGSAIVSWRAVTPSGVAIYGRCGGRGMCTTVRYAKTRALVGA